ncbi:hypothetical protein M5K25_016479 [Dendrobium thyrsiflorum]|uniref:Uncharacterized protein n=1 Tax=Dendrobium thyrsiflorum TaxID=117978 RepID=A0ABD0US38_DENTH
MLLNYNNTRMKPQHLALKANGGGNDDEPDQDPMVPSPRAIVVPGLLSQRRDLRIRKIFWIFGNPSDLDFLSTRPSSGQLSFEHVRSSTWELVDAFCLLAQEFLFF